MKKFAVLFLLSGCVGSTQTYAPDGSVGYTVSCSGPYVSWNSCLKEAGKICGSEGYEVFDRIEDRNHTRNMLIACGDHSNDDESADPS